MENSHLKQLKEKLLAKQQQRKELKEKQEAKQYINVKAKSLKKPYHEKYRLLFYLAIGGGVLANLLSGVTESSKIFAFWYEIFKEFSFANPITWFMVIIGVGFIELGNRFLGKSYFEEYAENEGHQEDMNGRLIGMIALSAISLFLSFGGSFDLIKLTKSSPTLSTASLMTKESIDNTYNKLIEDAQLDVDEYRTSRKYKNRLAKEDVKRYNELVNKKQELIAAHSTAVTNLSSDNNAEKDRIKKDNAELMATHNSAIENQGYGLGFLTIAAIIGLYVCLWYSAKYREEKKDYLEEKFKDEFDAIDDKELLPEDDKYQSLEEQIRNLQATIEKNKPLLPPPSGYVNPNGEYFHNNFIAQPNYYNPKPMNAPPNTTGGIVRVQGFLGRSNNVAPSTVTQQPPNNVTHCYTTTNNNEFSNITNPDIEKSDRYRLELDLRTYYTRSFLNTEVPSSPTKTKGTCVTNRKKVEKLIEQLIEHGRGTKINFDNYEEVIIYDLKKAVA